MFQLCLLGDPVLRDTRGTVVRLWRPATALLALTAVAPGNRLTRERAAGLLWPEFDEAKARRSLRQVLFRLRGDVGTLLIGDRTAVALNTSCVSVDVVEFERELAAGDATAAVDRWTGDFLAGFSLPGSTTFEHWADRERERLRTRLAESLDTLIDAATAAGDWNEALRRAQRRFDIDRLSERAAARLIELHHQSGDRARALALYDSIATQFVAELGVPPTRELAALAERIRQAPATPRYATSPATGAGAKGSPAFQLPLVGRAAEFSELMDQWAVACTGAQRIIVIDGEEGVGKTRLAADFRRWVAMRGATTLWSRAYEIERQIPYATLAGALREAMHAPGLAGIDDRTPSELGRIVPEFAKRFARAEVGPGSAGLEAGRLRIVEAARDVIDSIAYETPVLYVVDDLQWADEASLAALNYICRALPDSPLLLLITVRGVELVPTDPAMSLLNTLLRDARGAACRMTLEPLDEAAICEALAQLDPAPREERLEASALLRESGGNALFLTELLRARHADQKAAATSDGDDARRNRGTADRLSMLAADRFDRLPDEARRLLEAAAVLGRQFPLPLATGVATLDAAAATDAIDLLLRRGLLRTVEYGYDFAHGVLRREVLAVMGSARRAMLHARVYAQLEPAAATQLDEIGVERSHSLAHHAAQGGLHAEAHRWYLHAADRAIRLYAGEEAEAALRSALEHAVDDDTKRATLVQIGNLAWARSDYGGAARAYRTALEVCRDPDERLQLRIRILDAGLRGGILETRDADDMATQLLVEATAAGPAPLRDLLAALAEAYSHAGRRDDAVARAVRAVDAARSAGDPQRLVHTLLLLARLAVQPAETERPLAYLHEALVVALTHHLGRELQDTQIELGTELSRIGRWDEAMAALRTALAAARHNGEAGGEVVAAINLSDLLVHRGEWAEADTVLGDAERLADRHDFPHADAAILLNRALLAWLRGDDSAAAAVIADRAATSAAESGLGAVQRAARALLVMNRIEAGDTHGAIAEAERMDNVVITPHPHWADDGELAVIARARLARTCGSEDYAPRLQAAVTSAASACGAALLQLELAESIAPRDPDSAYQLRATATQTLQRLGAAPLARRLHTSPASAPARSVSGPATQR